MGTIGNIAGTGMNLLNERKQTKKAKKDLFQNYTQNTRKRKNLLDEQLASRRAKLGAAGIYSSPSMLAAQNRDIDQTYEDIDFDASRYQRDVKQTERNYRNNLYTTALGSNKVIK